MGLISVWRLKRIMSPDFLAVSGLARAGTKGFVSVHEWCRLHCEGRRGLGLVLVRDKQ